jgi:hypothetical protein
MPVFGDRAGDCRAGVAWFCNKFQSCITFLKYCIY